MSRPQTHKAARTRAEARAAIEPLTMYEEPMSRSCSGSGASDCCKLFVGGIAATTTTEALRAHFARYGCIVDAVVMNKNGRPRGFGFVTFDAPAAAAAVLQEQQWLDNRLVDVKRAVPGERNQERTSNKIFVGGLPQDVSTDDLRAYFGQYGAVADAVVMVDRRTSRSRGFGFVRFSGGAQGCAASEAVLRDFPTHRLGGKWVEVKRATPAALLQAAGELSPGMSELDLTSPTALAFLDSADFGMMDPYYGAANFMGLTTPTGACTMGEDLYNTPMGSGCGDLGDGARSRRGRRRKPRTGAAGDDDAFYCDRYDGAFEPAVGSEHSGEDSFDFVGTPLPGLRAAAEPFHMPGTPTAYSDPTPQKAPRNPGRIGGGSSHNKVSKKYEVNSENNPGCANGAENVPPGLFAGADAMPMKVPMKVKGASSSLIEAPPGLGGQESGSRPALANVTNLGEGFTREDFLSLEVGRPFLQPAW